MTLEECMRQGIAILDKPPEGWEKLDGATTAPKGYSWWFNRESHWSGKRKRALVKDEA